MVDEGEILIEDSTGETFYADWLGSKWLSLSDHSLDGSRSADVWYRRGTDGYRVDAAFFDEGERVDSIHISEVSDEGLADVLQNILTIRFPAFLDGIVDSKDTDKLPDYEEPPHVFEYGLTELELLDMNAFLLPSHRGTYLIQRGIRTNRVGRMHISAGDTTDVLYSIREPGGKLVESGGKTGMDVQEAENILGYLICVKFPERLEGISPLAWKRYAASSRRSHEVQDRKKSLEIAQVYFSELTRHRPQYNPQG